MQYLRPSRAAVHEARATIALALPLIGGQLSVMGMSTVDAVLAGHLSGEVLGAVGVGTALFHLANMTCLGVNAALSPSVAQLDGARRRGEIGPLFRQALVIALTLGLGLMLVVALAEPLLVRPLGFSAALASDTQAFLRGIAPAVPALSLFYACRGLSEGLSMPRPTMGFGLLGLALLMPTGYVLMYGVFGLPGLGAFGCGVATSLVAWMQVAGFGLWLRFSGRYRGLGWRSGPRRLDPAAIAGLLRIGVPMAVSTLMESGMFSAAGLAIGTFGAAAAASHQVALNVAAFCFMVPLGVALATTVRVGNAAGRGDTIGVRRAGLTGMGLALGAQTLSGTMLLSVPEAIAALYTNDPGVQAAASVLLRIAGIFQLSDGLQVTASGALRGLKDTRLPMIITAAAYWAVGMPVALALAFGAGWQAPGMWCGLIAGLTVAAALLTLRFLRLSAKLRRMVAV
jgi:MATE family multidrug resistance protein